MALNHARWVVVVVFQYYPWMKSDKRVSPDQSIVISRKKYWGLTTIINMKFWKPSYQTKLVENWIRLNELFYGKEVDWI